MEHYDSDKAARVWQRVRSEAQPAQELTGLPGLITAEIELAAWLRQLGKTRSGMEALARDCVRHAAILRGICVFLDVPRPQAKYTGTLPHSALRACYGKTMQAVAEYEKLFAHPEYGCAFRVMAEKKKEHACRLLEMAGNTQGR